MSVTYITESLLKIDYPDPMEQNGYNVSYGSKRPLWQWVVIYLIIGLIVYGLIYYFVIAGRSSYNPGSTTQQLQKQQLLAY